MRKHKRYRFMPYITIILFATSIMMLLNFPASVYLLNTKDYSCVSAEIISVGQDGLFSIVPKIEVSYTYNNKTYEQYYYNYNFWMYGGYEKIIGSLTEEVGNLIKIGVNKSSPVDIINWSDSSSLIGSWVNIVLIVINGVCFIILVNNLRRFTIQYVREKYTKKASKEARRRIKRERKNSRGDRSKSGGESGFDNEDERNDSDVGRRGDRSKSGGESGFDNEDERNDSDVGRRGAGVDRGAEGDENFDEYIEDIVKEGVKETEKEEEI